MSKVIKLAELSGPPGLWQPVEIEEQVLPEHSLPEQGLTKQILPCLEPGAPSAEQTCALEDAQLPPSSRFSEWLPILLAESKVVDAEEKQPERAEALPLSAGVQAWLPFDFDPELLEDETFSNQDSRSETLVRSRPVVREAEERAAQIVQQAEEQAGQALREAENQAAELVRDAEMQAAEVRRKAHKEGLAAAQAETVEMLQAAASIVEEFNAWREEQLSKGELMMLRLVIEIAQSIFGEGLPLEPDVLGQAFSRALAQAKPLGDLRVYAHPEDIAALGPLWPQRQATMSGQQIELIPSDIIKRGGCFVEGQYGSLDARVESQLQRVQDTLLVTAASDDGESPPAETEAGAA